MILPNPKLNRDIEKERRNRILEDIICDDDIIIEGIGPDGVKDWYQGGRAEWVAIIKFCLLQRQIGNKEAAADLGNKFLDQLEQYIDDLVTDRLERGY